MRSNAGGDGFGGGLGHADHNGGGFGEGGTARPVAVGDGGQRQHENHTQSTGLLAALQGDGSWGYSDGSGTDGSP